MIRKLIADTTGASALEYAIIASLVSVAAIGAFMLVGQQSKANFDKVDAAYTAAK